MYKDRTGHFRTPNVGDLRPSDESLELAALATPADDDPKIMIVDDATMTVRILQAFLEDAGYRRFVTTSDSTKAVELARRERPDAVLLDLHMPEVDGFQILKKIRATYDIRHTPVIILTASEDSDCKLRALELGATDFLGKPVDTSELALRLRNTLATKTYQDRLTRYDPLTDLPNRRLFLDRLGGCIGRAQRESRQGAMLHVNLDRFARINATLGNSAGDRSLKRIARRIDACLRSFDICASPGLQPETPSAARLGGDEFGVLLPRIGSQAEVEQFAQLLLAAICKPIEWDGQDIVLTATIGGVTFPQAAASVPEVMRRSTLATAHGRSLGRNRVEMHSERCEHDGHQQMQMESDLHRALAREELELFYQPKVDLKTGRIAGAEALLRWRQAKRGLISPGEFIPLAEQTGLIVPFGAWVINAVCQQIRRWLDEGLPVPNIAFNVSSVQFNSSDLVATLTKAVTDAKIDAQRLTLELTESAILDSTDEAIAALHAIRSLGLRLSLDDFGTGYSSLSYLEQLPIDQLKIDMSFIERIEEGGDAPIVNAIIAMAHSLNMTAVAEGVEEQHHVDYLRARQCDQYQGYFFSEPVDAATFAQLVRNQAAAMGANFGTGARADAKAI